MKKILTYLFIYPFALLIYWLDKLFDSIEALFSSEELENEVSELKDRINKGN